MNYDTAKQYLYELKAQTKTYGLERMLRFVEKLGLVHCGLPMIHVAGTNGKGSVCALLESIYRNAGYRTGLYTSPHLVDLEERIQVNRKPIDSTVLTERIPHLKTIAEAIGEEEPSLHPSFFEFMTALAFEHFRLEKVDIAIIETGLGGRLDATNVIQPLLSVITSIGLDHTEMLGETLAEIAFEKAGIIKPQVPVFIGHLPTEAERVIREVASARQTTCLSILERFKSSENYPQTVLHGGFQRFNSAVAQCAVEQLAERFPVSPSAIQTGLQQVVWEGRWQVFHLHDNKRIILDATHNSEGAVYLEHNLAEFVAKQGKPIILAGTTGDARARSLMPVIARHAKEIYLLKPNQSRASDFDVLENWIPKDFSGIVHRAEIAHLFPEPQRCILGNAGETLIVTGSIYLIGEVMERLIPNASRGGSLLQD